MNFEDMQTIWDTQKNEKLYAFDQGALQRIVDKDSRAITRDLKCLELAAIAALIGIGIVTLIDTFFNGDEYFQLVGVGIEFVAAGILWLRRRQRESSLTSESTGLIGDLDIAIKRVQATIQRGRELALFFSIFAFYGAGIRMIIYDWRASLVKLALAALCAIFVFIAIKLDEKRTSLPRLKNLESLRAKLLEN